MSLEAEVLRAQSDRMNETIAAAQVRFASFGFGVRALVSMSTGQNLVFCKDAREWRFMVEEMIEGELIVTPLLSASLDTRYEALHKLKPLFAELVSVCQHQTFLINEACAKAEAFLRSLESK